jgi:hypothetical protein
VIRTWGRNGPAEQLLRQGAGGRVRRLAGNSDVDIAYLRAAGGETPIVFMPGGRAAAATRPT